MNSLGPSSRNLRGTGPVKKWNEVCKNFNLKSWRFIKSYDSSQNPYPAKYWNPESILILFFNYKTDCSYHHLKNLSYANIRRSEKKGIK